MGLGRLIFYYHLSSARTVTVNDDRVLDFKGLTLTVMYFPSGSALNYVWRSGKSEALVCLGLWPSMMPMDLGETLEQTPFWAHCMSKPRSVSWMELPMTMPMECSAKQLVRPEIQSPLQQSYLKLKSRELLCLGMDAMLGMRRDRPASAINRKVDHAINLIEELRHTPSLAELASRVNLPASRLSDELKIRTGLSLREYILERRMHRARVLLQTTQRPLKQIAYDCGYNHASNFCIAYRRQFGVTPGEARDSLQNRLH